MFSTVLHQMLRICRHMDGDDHADDDHADIRYLITEGTLLYGNQFLFLGGGGESAKTGIPHLHPLHWHYTTCLKIATLRGNMT